MLFIWSDFFVMRSTTAPAEGTTPLTIHGLGGRPVRVGCLGYA
jgi:hypothetical protein